LKSSRSVSTPGKITTPDGTDPLSFLDGKPDRPQLKALPESLAARPYDVFVGSRSHNDIRAPEHAFDRNRHYARAGVHWIGVDNHARQRERTMDQMFMPEHAVERLLRLDALRLTRGGRAILILLVSVMKRLPSGAVSG
jgi:hypothetical protein